MIHKLWFSTLLLYINTKVYSNKTKIYTKIKETLKTKKRSTKYTKQNKNTKNRHTHTPKTKYKNHQNGRKKSILRRLTEFNNSMIEFLLFAVYISGVSPLSYLFYLWKLKVFANYLCLLKRDNSISDKGEKFFQHRDRYLGPGYQWKQKRLHAGSQVLYF